MRPPPPLARGGERASERPGLTPRAERIRQEAARAPEASGGGGPPGPRLPEPGYMHEAEFAAADGRQDGFWIFGYGSLVWRPDFEFEARRPAVVHGWTRRFWQGSTDHRGVPGRPGRVVTLLPAARGETCAGMAYLVAGEAAKPVMQRLDHREKGGYERRDVTLRFDDASRVPGLVYIATPGNRNYLGPAPLDRIAAQIVRSTGPSGRNADYLLRLAEALRAQGAEDAHVFDLEARVRALLERRGNGTGSALRMSARFEPEAADSNPARAC